MLRIRPNLVVTLCLIFGVIGIAACTSQKSQTEAKTGSTHAMTPIQRGEYLATISGCGDCHTPGTLFGAPDFNRTLSGSELGWSGPWGVSYPSNLTPDMETGLGSWTDADIERALRSGVKKDGTPIAPPMPWPDVARYTPEDMTALIAYLRSVPAVKHTNLGPIPLGTKVTGSMLVFPSPPAWDVPKEPAAK